MNIKNSSADKTFLDNFVIMLISTCSLDIYLLSSEDLCYEEWMHDLKLVQIGGAGGHGKSPTKGACKLAKKLLYDGGEWTLWFGRAQVVQ